MMITSELTKNKGLAALTTNPQDSKPKPKFTDNSTNNQRAKLLDYLQEHGSITTAQAREDLDIMSPAPRKMELVALGHLITMKWVTWVSEYGIKHRIGRYYLTQTKPIDCEAS
jgi:Helix-turn-helix domain